MAGLVDLQKVSRVILLAPPVATGMWRVLDKIAKRPGAVFNPDGDSKLPRADGTTTYLRKDYVESLDTVEPLELYQKVAHTKPTLIVRATNDEVLGMTHADDVEDATHIDIAADHNFTGESRRELVGIIRENLLQ